MPELYIYVAGAALIGTLAGAVIVWLLSLAARFVRWFVHRNEAAGTWTDADSDRARLSYVLSPEGEARAEAEAFQRDVYEPLFGSGQP